MATVLAAGGAYALASIDWCGSWPDEEPAVLGLGVSEGALRAGAARRELSPPYPVVVAGYPPPRPEAKAASAPLFARAVVLEVEPLRVGIVALDLLLVPPEVSEELRARAAALGLSDLWVSATHAHSSFGGYDRRLVSELAGTGWYRAEAHRAVVDSAAAALSEAAGQLAPAELSHGEGLIDGLVVARSGEAADPRLTRVIVKGPAGPVAQLIVLSAHPTLTPRHQASLSPDYPGALARLLEEEGGVALVLQGAGGNASVADGEGGPSGFVERVRAALGEVPLTSGAGSTRLGWARVSVALPRPDSSRLVASPFRAAGDNFLCGSASRRAELSALRLGPLRWLSVPGEPSYAAGRGLEERARAVRSVSLTGGYLGYVETPEAISSRSGESARQYFAEALLERLARGAALAGAIFD